MAPRNLPRPTSIISAALLVLASGLSACRSDISNGCEPTLVATGIATITTMTPAAPQDLDCSPDPVKITYSFSPIDPADPRLGVDAVDLIISSAQHLPRAWALAHGFDVGTTHPAQRWALRSPPCGSVHFVLTDLDQDAAIAACFPH